MGGFFVACPGWTAELPYLNLRRQRSHHRFRVPVDGEQKGASRAFGDAAALFPVAERMRADLKGIIKGTP